MSQRRACPRAGLEGAIDDLERAAALPVLPGHEVDWLDTVTPNLTEAEQLWTVEAREGRDLERVAARREERLLRQLVRFCNEARVRRRASDGLRLRVLAWSAGVRGLLERVRRVQERAPR